MHDRDGILQLHMNVGQIICTGGRHRALPSSHRLCRPQADLPPVVGLLTQLRT
jgi:hypothetical protein